MDNINKNIKKSLNNSQEDITVPILETSTVMPPEIRRRKFRLEFFAIIIVLLGLIGLLLLQKNIINLGPSISENQGLLTLISLNISIVFAGILTILILRNLYRLLFERKVLAGKGLQTKLLIAFISLSLLPTLIIFHFAYRIISGSHDLWFNPEIELALSDSLILSEATQNIVQQISRELGEDVAISFKNKIPELIDNPEKLKEFLEKNREQFHFTSLEFYAADGQLLAFNFSSNFFEQHLLNSQNIKELSQNDLKDVPWSFFSEGKTLDLHRFIWPIYNPLSEDKICGYFAVGRASQASLEIHMNAVRQGLNGYHSLVKLQKPIRSSQMVALAGITLLSIFVSTWIGSHLVKNITAPLTNLVLGTQKVAKGDLNFELTSTSQTNEFSLLVASFNKMTKDLKAGYAELDRRRQFLATLLDNISSGIIAVDKDGLITSLNNAAQKIFDLNKPVLNYLGLSLPEVLPPELEKQINQPFKAHWTQNLSFNKSSEESLSLHCTLVSLKDENGIDIGYLLAFEDLTELERAQRLSAWREVARRIAHEIKNPLTPIKLAAQRLWHKFSDKLQNDDEDLRIFKECVQVIIRQVDDMKELVDEFSQFARLPMINLQKENFIAIVEEVISLYGQAHKEVNFYFEHNVFDLVFYFDPTQMRQVLNNLLDNAVSAVNSKGSIWLKLNFNKELSIVKLTIVDSGKGWDKKIKNRIFEPYISTKKDGHGLGLVIVKTIITDHEGFIRIGEAKNKGAKVTIELPFRV